MRSNWVETVIPVINFFTTLIEKFGWPGALLLGAGGFVVMYASDEQKREIIDLYILGKGIGQVWPVVVLSVAFVATAFAQHALYRRRRQALEKEQNRMGREKSRLQEQLTGRGLQHVGETDQKKRG